MATSIAVMEGEGTGPSTIRWKAMFHFDSKFLMQGSNPCAKQLFSCMRNFLIAYECVWCKFGRLFSAKFLLFYAPPKFLLLLFLLVAWKLTFVTSVIAWVWRQSLWPVQCLAGNQFCRRYSFTCVDMMISTVVWSLALHQTPFIERVTSIQG